MRFDFCLAFLVGLDNAGRIQDDQNFQDKYLETPMNHDHSSFVDILMQVFKVELSHMNPGLRKAIYHCKTFFPGLVNDIVEIKLHHEASYCGFCGCNIFIFSGQN